MNRQGRVAGKVAIVTGAARGMGASHVRVLASEGATVIATDIHGPTTTDGVEGAVRFILHDVTDAQNWSSLVADVEATYGRIDVLVNNAGVQIRSFGVEGTDEELERVIAVNQRGVFFGMRAVVPVMLRAGAGSIVNIASVAALVGLRGSIPYQGSKAAVIAMSRGAAVSYGGQNIRVNAICPGLVVTDMTSSADSGAVDAMIAQIPLCRDGQAHEVSAGVLFFASDESSYVTGVTLPIDGGFVVP
ncbi:MAG: SDR family NAD(P)-dependent oxidoreductase [Acidimicrobiales bacterium]